MSFLRDILVKIMSCVEIHWINLILNNVSFMSNECVHKLSSIVRTKADNVKKTYPEVEIPAILHTTFASCISKSVLYPHMVLH